MGVPPVNVPVIGVTLMTRRFLRVVGSLMGATAGQWGTISMRAPAMLGLEKGEAPIALIAWILTATRLP